MNVDALHLDVIETDIIRLFEAHRARGPVRILFSPRPPTEVRRCTLLEEPEGAPLPIQDTTVTLDLRPFEARRSPQPRPHPHPPRRARGRAPLPIQDTFVTLDLRPVEIVTFKATFPLS
ncbi:MAG: glycosyl hydrolase-related protein [Pseudomonadota bacterium]